MSIRSMGFVAAMEDDAATEVEINIEPGVPAEVEAQAAEVADDADDIVDETQAMEDAVADAETLDMIADTAEQSVEEGEGMDPVAAEIAEVAVESIYNRLGVSRKAIPSLESFGSAGSRKSATRIAVEDWKDTVKKVWEAVKRFFANLWEKIKVLFEKVVNFFRGLDKTAQEMKKRVQALKGEAKEKEFTNEALAKGFGQGTGKATAATLASVLSASGDAGNKAEKQVDQVYNIIEAAKKAIDLIGIDESKAKEVIEKIKVSKESEVIGENLFNNTKVVEEIGENGHVSIKIEEVKGTSGDKVEVLTREEMVKTCDSVSAIAKNVSGMKKLADSVSKSVKSVSSVINTINRSLDKTESNRKELFSIIAKVVVSVGSANSKTVSVMASLSTKASKGALKYVELSMKQYKEEKKEETK